MSETANLLRLFRVDQQIRGLRSRLTAAERFLTEQTRQGEDLSSRQATSAAQLKQLKAAGANHEGECVRIETRMAALREQMNGARTNKEYSAFLNELNALKTQKEASEKLQLEAMEKVEQLQKTLTEIEASLAERKTIIAKAKSDRDSKEAEIKDRLTELTSQRETVKKEVDAGHARQLEDLMNRLGEEAMSHVEEIDRRNHEWSCGSCRMAVPPQTLSLIARGVLVNCPSCGCFLYTELDVVSKKLPKPKKGETLEA